MSSASKSGQHREQTATSTPREAPPSPPGDYTPPAVALLVKVPPPVVQLPPKVPVLTPAPPAKEPAATLELTSHAAYYRAQTTLLAKVALLGCLYFWKSLADEQGEGEATFLKESLKKELQLPPKEQWDPAFQKSVDEEVMKHDFFWVDRIKCSPMRSSAIMEE